MRRQARTDLLTWCEIALKPFGFAPQLHHRLIIRELQAFAGDVFAGHSPRLMICMPPGSAKSTYASVLFPAWFLAQRNALRIIGASSTLDLSAKFSREIISTIAHNRETLGYKLRRENQELWEVSNGGQYRAAGVGGTITGFRADLVVIDDPVKSREQADSEDLRAKQWQWATSDMRSRLRPGGGILLIMTRWHEDDLGGRFLTYHGDDWRKLILPAIASENDPLGRAPGEMLWAGDARYAFADELLKVQAEYERSGATRDWNALYQQDPRPLEGGLFKVGQIPTRDELPTGIVKMCRAWDFAATEQVGTANPDWTVGLKLAMLPENRVVVLDVKRARLAPEGVLELLLKTASEDGRTVTISLPQDPGQAGKWQAQDFVARLAGYTVKASQETGDKATRAAPVAAQTNVGNLSIMRAGWNAPFIEELRSFPSGTKDDQVDALSRAFGELVGIPQPIKMRSIPFIGR
jgi:predicted phage terminase large subunit-like protein